MERKLSGLRLGVLALAIGTAICVLLPRITRSRAQGPAAVPTHSSPIALDRTGEFVWAVNPDNDTVSVVDVRGDANSKVAEITVKDEPQSVAISVDNTKAYVANAVGGTVSVISVASHQMVKTLSVGTEP